MQVFIILYLIWFVLNGRFELSSEFLQIALFGLGVTAFAYLFLCKFTEFSVEKDKRFCRNIFLFIAYLGVLLKEIFMSNITIVKAILKPKDTSNPEIVHLHLGIKSKFINTLIANSITLTPGTITVDLEGDHFVVYSLRKDMIDGFENSTLVKLAKKMEA